jgi:hypothetical protein
MEPGSRAFAVRRFTDIAAALLASAGLVVLTSVAAGAAADPQPPATGRPVASVNHPAARPGHWTGHGPEVGNGRSVGRDLAVAPRGRISFVVGQFAPHALVEVRIIGQSSALPSCRADENGVARIDVRVPAGLSAGAHRIAVYGPVRTAALRYGRATRPSGSVAVTVPRLVFFPFSIDH